MPQISFRPVFGDAIFLAIACILLLSLWMFRAIRARVSTGKVLTLGGLRLLAILVALFAMVRMTLVYTTIRKQPATLAILVDTSRSMQFKDMVGGKSRYEVMRERLAEALPQMAQIGDELEIRIYGFDSTTRTIDFDGRTLKLPDTPSGDQSAIGAALNDVLREQVGKRLAAVLLFSDGAQQALPDRNDPPEDPVSKMASEGIKLYTLAFGADGSTGQIRDLAIKDLFANPTVFVKNVLTVSGNLQIRGFVNRPIQVELLFENSSGKVEVVASKTYETSADGGEVPVELEYVPETPGEYKISLRAKPQDGELVVSNNEVSSFVKVLAGGVNVLYLEGEVRVEQKYIRWSLGASQNINVEFHQIDARQAQPLPPEAAEWFKPGKFDVFIFGDLDAQAFKKEQIAALNQAVRERGAGFMMIGGLHSFGPGGWQQLGVPPQAGGRIGGNEEAAGFLELLPVAMERTERQGFNDPFIADLHLNGPQAMVPQLAAPFASLLLLDTPDKNAAHWRSFPPLDGANRFRGYSPRASVLIKNPAGQPLLLAQEVGAGRVLAFAGDSTWRWWSRGFHQEHRRFWRQLALWLAHQDETADETVWVKLPQRRYQRGDRVDILAGARTPQGEVLPDAELSGVVRFPDDSTHKLSFARKGPERTATFLDTNLPGDYVIEVTGTDQGKPLGLAKVRFLVQAHDLELDNPAARPDLLARLAAMTQAERLPPERLGVLVAQLAKQGLIAELPIETRDEVWDHPAVFLVFAGLLCFEWFLRKRWGLV